MLGSKGLENRFMGNDDSRGSGALETKEEGFCSSLARRS